MPRVLASAFSCVLSRIPPEQAFLGDSQARCFLVDMCVQGLKYVTHEFDVSS